ncbi:hypothetical protein QQ020_06895 [Fulvivirgaceae bacterium BMA12]|uniref:Uncharacterized protein n=1 Tax=Agaribacillus aureus TaxID=3051825 RepID=A0ABT8L231_9BACT|nr:hypothetical protein [Fulvivirgaceae bacterium BMA12]
MLHTHSHIALLGWVFTALMTILYKLYPGPGEKGRSYGYIFLFTQLTIFGMLVTFPVQGYALFSIIFSTLFLIASYWFAGFFIKNTPLTLKQTYSYRCIKAALWYLIISSLGPWALGAIMGTLGNTSIWYRIAIYFYLHFLYNGFFVLTLCGLFFYILEKYQLAPEKRTFKVFYLLVNASIILTFFLSVLWTKPPAIIFILGGLGAILQLIVFGNLIYFFVRKWPDLQGKIPHFVGWLFKVVCLLFIVKIMLQALSSIPYFAHLIHGILDLVIGYLHWVFLGVVSIGLFAFLHYFQLLKVPKTAFLIYIIGFFLSEALIIYKGVAVWLQHALFDQYFLMLVIVSALIPLGLFYILLENLRWKRKFAGDEDLRRKSANG